VTDNNTSITIIHSPNQSINQSIHKSKTNCFKLSSKHNNSVQILVFYCGNILQSYYTIFRPTFTDMRYNQCIYMICTDNNTSMICTDCTSYSWMLAWRWSIKAETCSHNKILICIHRCCVLMVNLNNLFYFSNSDTTGCPRLKQSVPVSHIPYCFSTSHLINLYVLYTLNSVQYTWVRINLFVAND